MNSNTSKLSCERGFTQYCHAELVSASTPYRAEALNKDTFRAPLRFGFTLIELLVVVLIIGILAAVAVPQYNKAVDKSRLMNLIQMGTNVRKAQEVYFLQNGTYAHNVLDLDVVYEESCSRGTDLSYYYCKDGDLDNIVGSVGDLSAHAVKIWYRKNKQNILAVWIYFAHSSKPNQVICEGRTDYGTKLCNTLNL